MKEKLLFLICFPEVFIYALLIISIVALIFLEIKDAIKKRRSAKRQLKI